MYALTGIMFALMFTNAIAVSCCQHRVLEFSEQKYAQQNQKRQIKHVFFVENNCFVYFVFNILDIFVSFFKVGRIKNYRGNVYPGFFVRDTDWPL